MQRDGDEAPIPPEETQAPIKDVLDKLNSIETFNFFDLPKYKKILVIGAGNGAEVVAFLGKGYEAIGTTIHMSYKKYAKKFFGIDLWHEDMHDMSFETGSFDGIFSYSVFEHTLSPFVLFFECRRLLKPDGKLIFNVPPPNSPTATGVQHYSVLSKEQWSHLLDIMGFDILYIDDHITCRAIKTNRICPATHIEIEFNKLGLI